MGVRIAGAAALIAVLTVLARLAGFVRTIVFSRSVGYTDLGDVYQTANTIPNIIFEIVAGGALAALVVPMLAGAIARGDRRAVGATASALLTWVLVLLVPLAAVVALAAYPIMWLLDPHASPDVLATGTRMLRVFAPQLPLYGVGIVLTGVLQAHRRFAWPVLAPLLSSLTVIGAYLTFALAQPRHIDIPQVGRGGELILSLGTTLGVLVLSLCLIPPVRRLGLSWRFTLAFAEEDRRRVRALAGVGVLTVAAQQLSLALAIALINWNTARGSLVLFTQAQTIYLLPWAVLAVPVATSTYPVLATAFAGGEGARLRRTLAASTRSVLLLCGLGAAALIALAWPAAWLLAHVTGGGSDVPALSLAIAGFAPGLLGYGLFALHSRALYAQARHRSAAVALTSVLLALILPARMRVPAISIANSVGMLLLGAVLLVLVARWSGRPALAGVRRAGSTALLAGTLATLAGVAVRWPLPATRGWLGVTLVGVVSGVVVAVVFIGVAALVDRRDLAPLLGAVARRVGRAAARHEEGVGR
jgi:putative peptidoglycan lipid II flippase